jgi:N-acetylglucosaminyl-diphospho-decaprenol L-rhamnosyltransferase
VAEQRGEVVNVAVVIVTFNSGDVLEGCLRSLATQTGVDLVSVVVADNASKDDCVELAEAAGADLPVRVVQMGRNAGYAAAINAATATLELRKLDAVLVLNPDCRLRPDTLARLAAALREPGRAVAAPKLLNPDGSLQPSLRRTPTVGRALVESVIGGDRAGRIGSLGELVFDPAAYEKAGPVAWVTGAAMLVSAAAVRELGPWDESFMLYSEETDYCLRATDRGWTLWYEPDAVVEHIGGDSAVNPVLYALMVANKVILFRRRRGAVAGAAYRASVVLGEAIRAAAGRRTSRASLGPLMKLSRRDELIATLTGARP